MVLVYIKNLTEREKDKLRKFALEISGDNETTETDNLGRVLKKIQNDAWNESDYLFTFDEKRLTKSEKEKLKLISGAVEVEKGVWHDIEIVDFVTNMKFQKGRKSSEDKEWVKVASGQWRKAD